MSGATNNIRGCLMRTRVVDDIVAERKRQIEKGYTAEKDDSNDPLDWYECIKNFNLAASYKNDQRRQNLIKVAALAIAAVDSLDNPIQTNS